jgi:hypothetical protein
VGVGSAVGHTVRGAGICVLAIVDQ